MTFKDFVGSGSTGIIGLINAVVIPIIFTLAFVVFIWGIVNAFIIHGADGTAQTKGRNMALWGLIGMVALFSIWSIVAMLLSTLGISPGG